MPAPINPRIPTVAIPVADARASGRYLDYIARAVSQTTSHIVITRRDYEMINPDAKKAPPAPTVTTIHVNSNAKGPTPEQVAVAEARADICEACDHVKHVTRRRTQGRFVDHPFYTAGCKQCGCGGLSLLSPETKCPEGKWDVKVTVSATPAARAVDPSTAFDRIVVVNLDRRADRWRGFQEQLPTDWPFRQPERFSAVDGQRVPPPAWWRAGRGAWGCYQSHLRIIEQAINDGVKSLLILEDDVLFADDFTARLATLLGNVPGDWHQLYLGGQHLRRHLIPPEAVTPGVVRCRNVNRAHAYAMRGDGLKLVYRHLTNWMEIAQQHKTGKKAWHVDHWFGQAHEARAWNVYAPTQWMVGQSAGKSNISGKDLGDRFWQVKTRAHGMTKKRRKFLILGHPRSATKFSAHLMQAFGEQVGHERMGSDGISSWMLAVDGKEKSPYGDGTRRGDFDYDNIIYWVRHPLKVLASSMQTEAPKSLRFRLKWAATPVDMNEYEQAVHILLAWDRLILAQNPHVMIRAECAEHEIGEYLGRPLENPLPPKDMNTRKHTQLSWRDLESHLRPALASAFTAYAERLGYNLENTDELPNPQTPRRMPRSHADSQERGPA